MGRKTYTLGDIQKYLTFVPPAFVTLLAIFSIIVSYLIMEYRQNSRIDLLTQKYAYEQKLSNQNNLNNFINKVNLNIKEHLSSVEEELKKSVHTIKGINSVKTDMLPEFLKKIENESNTHFVIFDEGFEIFYGEKHVQNIQNLIFNNKTDNTYLYLTMLYISSQGDSASFVWRDDLQKTIQLSYLERSFDKQFHIGAFSQVDNLKSLTSQSYISAIREDVAKPNNAYFWIYDAQSKKSFNLENNKKWQITHSIDGMQNFKYLKKYFLYVGIKENANLSKSTLHVQKQKIRQEYTNKKLLSFSLIIFTAFVLITFTTLFSSFIKRIFSNYNRSFENKNRQLNTIKERYELAIIASNDGLWDTNFKTNKTFFSRKWLNMLGYKVGDITSYEEWFELIHKDDRAAINTALNEHINDKTKEHLICEYRLRTKDGSYKWVLARGKVFMDEKERPQRLLMMSMDIDERKRVAKNLKDTELLVSDGDITFTRIKNDERLNILFISESIKMYGYEIKLFKEKNFSFLDLIHKEDKDSFIASLNAHIKQNLKSFTHSYRIVTKSSEIKWVFHRIIFIKDDLGNIISLYGYLHDITALKKNEAELEEMIQIEVKKNQEQERLLIQQNKLASMGEMIGSIAHQWRQPLNNISLMVHFIRDNIDSPEFKENLFENYINKIKKQIAYMSETIDDFRNFYKPSKAKSRFDIKEALNTTISIMQTELEKEDIQLNFTAEPLHVNGFENEFKQAILNILSNAKDAIISYKKSHPEFHPHIDIQLQQEKNGYKLTIFNNGGNANKEVIERMFEPYFTTKFEDKGTGIGLYMTKTIIEESMKGSITAKNLKEGVVFEIRGEL